MTGGAPEFSRPVSLTRLGKEPLCQEIAANAEERVALARRLDLVSLDRLSATVDLAPQRDRTILLTASFAAEFVQSCVVTLDPVGGAIAENFSLRYGPPGWESEIAGDEDEPAFEPLSGTTIDIGEAVAQELALALPPFPRVPGTSVETELGGDAEARREPGPFAGLVRLVGRGAK
ncbi:MAG TPA: DUF177 domain-containing protein [Stellaceae bacterium]|nr:DUF177 domain-containing protein [Stellaceae bacterium]